MATAAFRPPPNIDPVTGLPVAPIIPGGVPGLPAYPGIAGVNELFDPNFGRSEVIMAGAENAIAGGWGVGGFGLNQTNRLLDSERKANFLAGHQILEPYLQRDFQAGENAAERQARMDQIAAEGAQALQRLQLSEAGEGQRLTQREEAEARRQIVAGQQAMQQLTLQEAGDTGRATSQIRGQLANTLLSGVLSGKGGGTDGGTGTRGYVPPGYRSTDFSGASPSASSLAGFVENNRIFNAPPSPRPSGSSGLGSTSIDQLLRKYGLL